MICPKDIRWICGEIWTEQGSSSGCIDVLTGELTDKTTGNTLDLTHTTLIIFPGYADIHVHLRGLNQSYKEDEYTGTKAAASQGITFLADMPNTSPRLDTPEALDLKLKAIKRKAQIPVKPYAAVPQNPETVEKLAKRTIAGFKIYPSDLEKREASIKKILETGKLVVLHPELPEADRLEAESISQRGTIRGCHLEGAAVDILASLSDNKPSKIHVTHASCLETVMKAKTYGFTVDVAPHHIIYNYDQHLDISLYKVNPPLRSMLDSYRLLQLIIEGRIDIIASDHAPHAEWEKKDPLSSRPGIPWLEAWPSILRRILVKPGALSQQEFFQLTVWNPRKLVRVNTWETIVVYDPYYQGRYTGSRYSKAIPYYHYMSEYYGEARCVYWRGRLVYG
ncbi:MAG: amidohydrolase family protein [Desulfurococcales archaeon]|nr:amidohydrolase family protein [Desulfurococcales archaeon]